MSIQFLSFNQLLIILTVVVTLALILTRPMGLSEGWAAGGAGAMLLVSPLAFGDLPWVFDETHDVLIFLLGMMVLTHPVEHAGVFERLADGCARLACGNSRLIRGDGRALAGAVDRLE